jgi:cytidylate kinase
MSPSTTPADRTTLVVAVDGPSGAGKSSVSRGVAAALGLRYLDTGSMYRAVTWWVLGHGVDPADPAAVAGAADMAVLEVGTDPASPTIAVDGEDVAQAIRRDDVTGAVSAVSAVPEVRRRMVALQRAAIGRGGIVVEGRDIGTAVAPDAPVKVYLTASDEVRAARRAAEHSALDGADEDLGATLSAMQRRDVLDSSRPASPLRRADDAVVVDATNASLDEVVARVLAIVAERTGAAPRAQR